MVHLYQDAADAEHNLGNSRNYGGEEFELLNFEKSSSTFVGGTVFFGCQGAINIIRVSGEGDGDDDDRCVFFAGAYMCGFFVYDFLEGFRVTSGMHFFLDYMT